MGMNKIPIRLGLAKKKTQNIWKESRKETLLTEWQGGGESGKTGTNVLKKEFKEGQVVQMLWKGQTRWTLKMFP